MKIETQVAHKRTTESLRYGEDLMDALELSDKFKEEIEQYSIELEIYQKRIASGKKASAPGKPQASIKFLGRNIFEHIALHMKRIRSSELENTLQFLNQKQCFSFLFYLEHYLRTHQHLELVTRAILYILKTYQVQLKQDHSMLNLLKSITVHMRYHFKQIRDSVGMNTCAIKLIRKEMNDKRNNEDGLDFDKPEAGDAFMF